MCQMDAHMETTPQQILLNPEKKASANGDNDFVAGLPSKVEKFPLAPSPSESGKKKRVQRAAKLKQCKRDARREQWLAQVSGKVSKADSCASSHSSSQDDREDKELYLQSSPGDIDASTLDNKERREDLQPKQTATSAGDREMWSEGHFLTDIHSGQLLVDGTQQNPLCRPPSPVVQNSELVKDLDDKETECKAGDTRRLDVRGFTNAWSTSDTSSSQSNSSQVSSSSDDENDVEDWEAVADALHVQVSVADVKLAKPEVQYVAQNRPLDQKSISLSSSDMAKCILKPESKYRPGNCGSRSRADVGRAWRPDDVSRPPTLPRLSKQHSFPLQSGPSLWSASHGNVWGLPPPAPSHCPICTEELDPTDSSFLPCSCGFRLCLFCHHRILVGDGRCPGCRKSYNTEAAAKLSRTASVRPRV